MTLPTLEGLSYKVKAVEKDVLRVEEAQKMLDKSQREIVEGTAKRKQVLDQLVTQVAEIRGDYKKLMWWIITLLVMMLASTLGWYLKSQPAPTKGDHVHEDQTTDAVGRAATRTTSIEPERVRSGEESTDDPSVARTGRAAP